MAVVTKSALDGVAKLGRLGRVDGEPGIVAQLRDPLSIALVTARQGQGAACEARLAAAAGGGSLAPCRAIVGGSLDVAWTGPHKYLVSTADAGDIEARLRKLCGETAAVVDQSDGRFVLRLQGSATRACLAKGVAIDLDHRVFGRGATAAVWVSHLQAQLTCLEKNTFDLTGPRAAAGDLWHWLVASAEEYGLDYGNRR